MDQFGFDGREKRFGDGVVPAINGVDAPLLPSRDRDIGRCRRAGANALRSGFT